MSHPETKTKQDDDSRLSFGDKLQKFKQLNRVFGCKPLSENSLQPKQDDESSSSFEDKLQKFKQPNQEFGYKPLPESSLQPKQDDDNCSSFEDKLQKFKQQNKVFGYKPPLENKHQTLSDEADTRNTSTAESVHANTVQQNADDINSLSDAAQNVEGIRSPAMSPDDFLTEEELIFIYEKSSDVAELPTNEVPLPREYGEQTDTLREENDRLKEERTCKICLDNEVTVAFVPCGHAVACGDCAKELRQCAMCRSPIQSSLRIYMN